MNPKHLSWLHAANVVRHLTSRKNIIWKQFIPAGLIKTDLRKNVFITLIFSDIDNGILVSAEIFSSPNIYQLFVVALVIWRIYLPSNMADTTSGVFFLHVWCRLFGKSQITKLYVTHFYFHIIISVNSSSFQTKRYYLIVKQKLLERNKTSETQPKLYRSFHGALHDRETAYMYFLKGLA